MFDQLKPKDVACIIALIVLGYILGVYFPMSWMKSENYRRRQDGYGCGCDGYGCGCGKDGYGCGCGNDGYGCGCGNGKTEGFRHRRNRSRRNRREIYTC